MKTARALFDRYWLATAFYVGCPIMISLPLGIFQAGLGRFMTPMASCLLWAGCWLTTWIVSEVLLAVATAVLRPWQPRLLVLLLVAGIAGILISPFYIGAISDFCFRIGGVSVPPWIFQQRVNLTDPSYLLQLMVSGSYGLFAWCGLRWAYEHLRQNRPDAFWNSPSRVTPGDLAPLSTYGPTGVPSDRLLSQLRKNGIAEPDAIEVIQAEDHYVRLHLAHGSRLVFYRFADILAEMRCVDGLQVHRSFWVRRACIADVQRDAGGLRLQMTNGLIVPVSQKHQALVGYRLDDRAASSG